MANFFKVKYFDNSKGSHNTEINFSIANATKVYHSLKNFFIEKDEMSIKTK